MLRYILLHTSDPMALLSVYHFLPTVISRCDHKNLLNDAVSCSLQTAETQLLSAFAKNFDIGSSSQPVARKHAWLVQPG